MTNLSVLICIFKISCAVCDNAASPRPTLVPKPFNTEDDIRSFYKSYKGFYDRNVYVNIMGGRTLAQRLQINAAFESEYKSVKLFDLFDWLGANNFSFMLKDLLVDFPLLIANKIHASLHESHDWLYMIFLCSTDGELLKNITSVYFSSFKRSLSEAINDGVKQKPAKKFLMSLVDEKSTSRPNTAAVDSKIADQLKFIPDRKDSNGVEIVNAVLEDVSPTSIHVLTVAGTIGFCKMNENKDLFDFLSKESYAQIKAVAAEYQKQKSVSVTDRFGKFCDKDDLRLAYTMIVSYALDTPTFFATQLNDAMERATSKTETLNLIVITRSEIDMEDIKDAFQKLYNKSLADRVEDHTTEYYRDLLLRMINGNVNS